MKSVQIEYQEINRVADIEPTIKKGNDFWFRLAYFKSNRIKQLAQLQKYVSEGKIQIKIGKQNNRFIYCKIK